MVEVSLAGLRSWGPGGSACMQAWLTWRYFAGLLVDLLISFFLLVQPVLCARRLDVAASLPHAHLGHRRGRVCPHRACGLLSQCLPDEMLHLCPSPGPEPPPCITLLHLGLLLPASASSLPFRSVWNSLVSLTL